MGLALEVGILSDIKVDGGEVEYLKGQFNSVSRSLVAAGLEPHREPEDFQKGDTFSCDMWGYSGLHYLRRIAAYIALSRPNPIPGDDKADEDVVVQQYYDTVTGQVRGLARLFRRRTPTELDFQHLMLHSDAEGYYIPQDFRSVIFDDETAGQMIGSSRRLLDECSRLAEWLEIPSDLTLDDEELWFACEDQGESDTKYLQYAIESFTCIRLIRACETSIRTGAALCFC